MKKYSIGIMQGRLTPSRGRGIQFFPFDFWKEEFDIAKKIGLSEIEWIMDYDRYDENPFWTKDGCNIIRKKISETGVKVNSVCYDYFMRRAFYKEKSLEKKKNVRKENVKFTKRVIDNMTLIGATLLEIPLIDESSVKESVDEQNETRFFLREIADYAVEKKIKIGLETDFSPVEFKKFLNSIGKNNIYANYDTGNSSGRGYDPYEEIHLFGEYIYNIHIKDRVLGNGTVRLGTGSADFDKVFASLKEIGYKNSIILQAARDKDGKESDNISNQIGFVEKYLMKVGMIS